MAAGDASRDLKENTRAIRELANSQGKLLKILEVINTNLLAVAQQLQKPIPENCSDACCDYLAKHKHGFACDRNCLTCKGQPNGH